MWASRWVFTSYLRWRDKMSVCLFSKGQIFVNTFVNKLQGSESTAISSFLSLFRSHCEMQAWPSFCILKACKITLFECKITLFERTAVVTFQIVFQSHILIFRSCFFLVRPTSGYWDGHIFCVKSVIGKYLVQLCYCLKTIATWSPCSTSG